jgi:cysteine-rich repeat protein
VASPDPTPQLTKTVLLIGFLFFLAQPVVAQVDMTGRWQLSEFFPYSRILDFAQTGSALEAVIAQSMPPLTFTGQFDDGGSTNAFTLYGPSFSLMCTDPSIIRATVAADGRTFSGRVEYPLTDFCTYVSFFISGEQIEPHCGDTVIDPAEECDDGNSADGDECDAACRIEPRLNGVFYLRNTENSGSRRFDQRVRIVQSGREIELREPQTDELIATGLFTPASVAPLTFTFTQEPCVGPVEGFAHPPNAGQPQLRPGFFVRGERYFADGGTCARADIVATRCGGGVLDPGEQCDDGNVASLDGCSSSCTIEDPLPCPPAPASCTGSVQPEKSRLLIRGKTITWTVRNISAINPTFLSDPITESAWLFCLYDLSTDRPTLISAGRGGPGCKSGDCWDARSNGGFVYRNRTPAAHELSRWTANPRSFGNSSIIMRGSAPSVTLPSLPLAAPVHLLAQLVVVDDSAFDNGCWQALYGGAGVRRNDASTLHVVGTP